MGIQTMADMTDFEQQQVSQGIERDGGFLLAIRCLMKVSISVYRHVNNLVIYTNW